MAKCLVVGSGFAGVFTALPLLEKGHEVIMLDIGKELDESSKKKITSLIEKDENSWAEQDLAFMKENVVCSASGVEKKLHFGSEYVYSNINDDANLKTGDAKIILSAAKGGLSNVWGCSILPFCEKDIDTWPIDYSELEKAYKQVIKQTGFKASNDDLEAILPSHAEKGKKNFSISKQALKLLSTFKKHKRYLNTKGIFLDQARLASNQDQYTSKDCTLCGTCLYGCCYNYLFSTQGMLKSLMSFPKFQYISKLKVEHIDETNLGINVFGTHVDKKESVSYFGDYVFLGAGAIGTTKIVLNSLKQKPDKVTLKHSDHFQLPVFSWFSTKDIASMRAYTLSQLSLILDNSEISDRLIHMQIYGYNDLYSKILDMKFRGPLKLLTPLKKILLSRLFIIKGYLHSDASSHMAIKLISNRKKCEFDIAGIRNPTAHRLVKKISWFLLKHTRHLGFLPLSPLVKLGPPGEGNHYGGTFPMKEKPSELETDKNGKLSGYDRLYIVDSSCFPSIPATTITYTIMANSYRIASKIE